MLAIGSTFISSWIHLLRVSALVLQFLTRARRGAVRAAAGASPPKAPPRALFSKR